MPRSHEPRPAITYTWRANQFQPPSVVGEYQALHQGLHRGYRVDSGDRCRVSMPVRSRDFLPGDRVIVDGTRAWIDGGPDVAGVVVAHTPGSTRLIGALDTERVLVKLDTGSPYPMVAHVASLQFEPCRCAPITPDDIWSDNSLTHDEQTIAYELLFEYDGSDDEGCPW